MTTKIAYDVAYQAYITAHDTFWMASIDEMRRLIPEGYVAVTLEVNDTPRLAARDLVTADGEFIDAIDFGELFDDLDQIAANLPVTDHDDACTWLEHSDPDGDHYDPFIIRRD